MTFTCGHDGSEPSNMGRGSAREKRLAEYFAGMETLLLMGLARIIEHAS